MRSILDTCQPRQSILRGTFNPEIFTASLGPVIQYYKGQTSAIDAIYTDADAFFSEATFPTHGLVQTVGNVFRRLVGDATVPTIQRLETAFGGGKTHTLIACVHLAYRGKELAEAARDVISADLLPEPGAVTVVGVAGDEIPVNKTKGDVLIPYTLWGELAYQIGGSELYNAVKDDAESFAAPGRNFLDTILKDRKILIMLDELAQYAARLEVAKHDGAAQLSAFLMALIEYAKATTGIAIVVTLASASDAFSKQTQRLTQLLNDVGNGEITRDDAVTVAEGAARSLTSVIRRNETTITPVDANELSAVLAKRLFVSIDGVAAHETADEYAAMYRKNSSALPEEATNVDFVAKMVSMYPFHPTFVAFLNNKLSQAENFQGTRGVLRTLALTVRSIWAKRISVGMIHVSDVDLSNAQIADEILGRTSSADLRTVLTADIGSVDSFNLEGGLSNAQRADRRNPHPDGIAMYEKTWRTVFLNSLVGRAAGKGSNVFGVSQKDAVFQIATPLFTPSQVKTALDEISQSAFYLRYEDGKYFAHLDPTINSVLAMIRSTVDDRQIAQRLKASVSSLVDDNQLFHIEKDVHTPQDISDNQEKPTVSVIALDAGTINIKEMYTTKGDGIPRVRQNLVLLLVPKTVDVVGMHDEQIMLDMDISKTEEAKRRLEDIARQVVAIRSLEDSPSAYGISASKLRDSEFVERKNERNLALNTTVSEMYTGFYYAGPAGFEKKELRSSSGEGGATLLGQIETALVDAGELIRPRGDRYGAAALKSLAEGYVFQQADRIRCKELLEKFYQNRSWPMIPNKDALERLLREGVDSAVWVAYKMSGEVDDDIPVEFYSQKKPLPLSISLINDDFSLMTVDGARRRGWTETDRVSNEKVRQVLEYALQTSGAATVQQLREAVQTQYANAEEDQVDNSIRDLIQSFKAAAYEGKVVQQARPDELVEGYAGFTHSFSPDEVIISHSEIAERGWNANRRRVFSLEGNEGAKKLLPILKRIGSLYTRSGAKSSIDRLDITDMKLPGGGRLRVALENAGPEDIRRLDEFFQNFCEVARITDETEVDLTINNPEQDCALMKELRGN